MQTAEYDHNDFNQSASSKLDEQLLVKFFTKEVEHRAKSLEEGRPIYRTVEYVDIKVPGNRTGGACRPATHADKQRFPRHYQAFKQRQEMPVEGTPLAEWPIMTRSQVEELAFYNVKTVEQLISMSDSHAGRFMGINELKKKAALWLEEADSSKRINEIESLKKQLSEKDSQVLTLEGQMKELMAKVEKMDSKTIVNDAIKPASKRAKV